MKRIARTSLSVLAAASIAATGLATAPQPAHAGSDFVTGLIIGGGAVALINEANKNKKRKSSPSRSTSKTKSAPAGPRVTIATFPTTRDQVRDYQSRLNALGFNAGAPDGIYGGMTRRAVNDFQTSIGAVPTGRLSESDAGFLVQRTSQPLIAATGAMPGYNAGAAQQPMPTFPTTAGAAQPQPYGAAPVFPTIGTGSQQPATATPTFPTIAAPAPAQGQMAFNAAPAAAQPTFPAIAAPATAQPAAAQPTFPAFSGTAEGQQQPAATASAPSFGTAQPTFPVIQTAAAPAPTAAAPANPSGFLPTVALPAAPEPKPAPVAEAERFSIFDIATGATLAAARQQLAFEGLSSCEEAENLTHCSADRGQVQDLVALQTVEMADGTTQVGAMSRHLTFAQPMARAQLSAMMADRYGTLLAAPNQMIGSPDCLSLTSLASGDRAELTARIMSGDTASLAALAKSCGHFSRIVFGPDASSDQTSELSIFLFDGSIFAAGVGADQPAVIKF